MKDRFPSRSSVVSRVTSPASLTGRRWRRLASVVLASATALCAVGVSAASALAATPHVYWTSAAPTNTIGRANLNGIGVNLGFITGAHNPLGVAVNSKHIYWTNAATNTIGEANLNGTGVNQGFITGANTPVGVAVSG